MKLRLATIDDRAAIARVHCDSWIAAFSKFSPEIVKARGDQFPRRFETWGNLLSSDDLFTYIALDGETITGFGQGGQVRDELVVPHDGELHRLYVSPQSKGQGVGKQLIRQVAEALKDQGNRSLVVVAWSINLPAREFYEYLGAKFVKEIVQEKDGFNASQTVYVWENINSVIEATS